MNWEESRADAISLPIWHHHHHPHHSEGRSWLVTSSESVPLSWFWRRVYSADIIREVESTDGPTEGKWKEVKASSCPVLDGKRLQRNRKWREVTGNELKSKIIVYRQKKRTAGRRGNKEPKWLSSCLEGSRYRSESSIFTQTGHFFKKDPGTPGKLFRRSLWWSRQDVIRCFLSGEGSEI